MWLTTIEELVSEYLSYIRICKTHGHIFEGSRIMDYKYIYIYILLPCTWRSDPFESLLMIHSRMKYPLRWERVKAGVMSLRCVKCNWAIMNEWFGPAKSSLSCRPEFPFFLKRCPVVLVCPLSPIWVWKSWKVQIMHYTDKNTECLSVGRGHAYFGNDSTDKPWHGNKESHR